MKFRELANAVSSDENKRRSKSQMDGNLSDPTPNGDNHADTSTSLAFPVVEAREDQFTGVSVNTLMYRLLSPTASTL